MKAPEKFAETILLLADLLKDYHYAIRGTASLVLQGFDMAVTDIDIYCDAKTSLKTNEILKDYLVEKVKYKESDKFKSYYGKFRINDIAIEIMGELQIKDTKGIWGRPKGSEERLEVKLKGQKVYVSKVETELSAYAMMGRWNAFHKLKKQAGGKEGSKQLELI